MNVQSFSLIALLALAACQTSTGLVEGKVVDANGQPIADVVVTDGYNFTQTDSLGRYELDTDPENSSLAGFLDTVALYTDMDDTAEDDNCVSLMTMHSAKGLEFPDVYVVGMEEGMFPSGRAAGESEEMEEERRLCYVAMTRAKERLFMTCASQRMLFGRTNANRPSRFVGEIPEELVERGGRQPYDSREERPQTRQRPARPAVDRGFSMGRPAPTTRSTASTGAQSAPAAQYRKGDRVAHKAFGAGLVVSLTPMGGDALVEIAFDDVGTKKLMLKSASAYLRKL